MHTIYGILVSLHLKSILRLDSKIACFRDVLTEWLSILPTIEATIFGRLKPVKAAVSGYFVHPPFILENHPFAFNAPGEKENYHIHFNFLGWNITHSQKQKYLFEKWRIQGKIKVNSLFKHWCCFCPDLQRRYWSKSAKDDLLMVICVSSHPRLLKHISLTLQVLTMSFLPCCWVSRMAVRWANKKYIPALPPFFYIDG